MVNYISWEPCDGRDHWWFNVNCHRWTHKIENCWRLHLQKAPEEWNKKAEERKKYEEEMDFRFSIAHASTTRKEKVTTRRPIEPEMKEWEEGRKRFEEIERFMREERRKERKDDPVCDHCKRRGHTKNFC